MSETVSALMTAVATDATTFQYTITLTDTGTTPIGTFWFAWNDIPDENFLPLNPTSVQVPAGWKELVTHGAGTDGYGIQWVATSAAADISPGGSLSGFTFTTTAAPSAVLSASQADPNFQTTSSFVYQGTPFSDAGLKFVVPGLTSAHAVTAAFAGIQRVQPSADTVATTVDQVETGQQTMAQLEISLIGAEPTLYTTLPALVTIDAFYNATPRSSTLDAAAAATGSPSQIGGFYAAQYLHNLGYSDPNVWTIMASQWGSDPTSAFFKQYNSFGTDFSGFISSVYQREFGFAPSAANLQTLVNDVAGVQALLAGGSGAATPIQVEAGLYGYLLYVGQTTPTLASQYATAANAFLQAAANGTVNYGQELTAQFPAGSTNPGTGGGTATGNTGTGTPGASGPGYDYGSLTSLAMIGPSVITVSTPDQLIDPGAGDFTIRFQPGASADTLMLHTGGVDQIAGFDPATDALDVSALLSEAKLNPNGDVAALSGYLTVVDQGADALVRFDPTGQGGGATVAVLQGLGSSVTGLDSLLAHGAVRMA